MIFGCLDLTIYGIDVVEAAIARAKLIVSQRWLGFGIVNFDLDGLPATEKSTQTINHGQRRILDKRLRFLRLSFLRFLLARLSTARVDMFFFLLFLLFFFLLLAG